MLTQADRIAGRRRVKLEQTQRQSNDGSPVSRKMVPDERQPYSAPAAKARWM